MGIVEVADHNYAIKLSKLKMAVKNSKELVFLKIEIPEIQLYILNCK